MTYMTMSEEIWFEQGEQQGIQRGIQQGEQQGESKLLLSLLEEKFKIVPEQFRQRITDANAKTLLLLARRVIHANLLKKSSKIRTVTL